MATFLLNSAVLTAYGEYAYSPLPVDAARSILAEGFTSAVGHAGAAEFCSTLLEMPVPYNRIPIEMQPGDRAVVIRIKERLPEGKSLSADEVRAFGHEVGLLERLR